MSEGGQMEFTGFERAMMGLVVGNTPQPLPAGMHMAVRLLEVLEITEEMIVGLDGVVFSSIVGNEKYKGIETDLTPDEKKFVTKLMVRNGGFGGRMLRLLIPLWERLYANWEELALDGPAKRPGRPRR